MDVECRLDGRTWHINLSLFYDQILVPHVYGSCLWKISLQNLKYAKDLEKVCDFVPNVQMNAAVVSTDTSACILRLI